MISPSRTGEGGTGSVVAKIPHDGEKRRRSRTLGRAGEHSNQEVSPWRLGFVDPWSCPRNSLSGLLFSVWASSLMGWSPPCIPARLYYRQVYSPNTLVTENFRHLQLQQFHENISRPKKELKRLRRNEDETQTGKATESS